MTTSFQAPVVLTLQIDSSIGCISPLGEAINSLCLFATDNQSCASKMQLAVVEAINNIVLHAYNKRLGNPIIVKWINENGRLCIEITDFGDSMPTLPTPTLAEWDAESGRGWWIINACVDEYHYAVVEYSQEDLARLLDKSHGLHPLQTIHTVKANVLTLIKEY